MSLRTAVAAVVAITAAAVPLLTGCADEEVAPRQAAFPQAAPVVGETPPSQVGVNASLPPSLPPPPPPYGTQGEQQQPGAAGQDVAVDGQLPPGAADPAQDEYAETDPSALTDFRSTLDPYGQWVDDPTYGTAWVPSQDVVGADFVPYQTAGHWTYDDDYTWVSDYDWGWAPFHYGRWVYAGGYGWEWIPGRVYAGAWVSWRYGWGDWGYVGWAPLGPTWCWRGGYAYGLGFVPVAPYGFVATGNLFAPRIGPVLVTGPRAGTIAQNTRPWVGAHPTVNGRVGATPRVTGPSPQVLNIPASQIAHGGSNNRGVQQAMAYARPSTATPLGARPPQAYGAASAASPALGGRGFAPSTAAVASGARAPAYGAPAPSHFGGRLGGGFSGSVNNVRPSPYYRAPSSSSSFGGRPYYGASPSHGGFGGYGGGYGGYRGFGGSTGFGAAHPGVAPGGGRRGGYSSGESSGGFHGGGFSGGGFRGGGGGFHGGGGGGGHAGGGRR